MNVSPDGQIAVFQDFVSDTETAAIVYDTHSGEVTHTVLLGEASRVLATGVSSTGRLTAMYMPDDSLRAGIWSSEGGWTEIESPYDEGCDVDVGAAFDVSADGSVAVGLMWNGCSPEAFRWTDAAGVPVYSPLETLGFPMEDGSALPTNRATKISADGRVAAGFAQMGGIDRSPAVWDETGAGVLLAPDFLDAPGEVLSIDGTGETVAGVLALDGFVWTKSGGMKPIERFDLAMPSDPVYPLAMTADGTTIFGGVGSDFFSLPTAFVWTATEGMRPLLDIATEAGIEAPEGLWLKSVMGASADGTVLVGTAMTSDGTPKTFLLRLPSDALGN